MSIIRKVWGTRHRLLESERTEIDLLYLEKDSACSVHSHNHKINRFVLIKGKVQIASDIGTTELVINEPFDVEPITTHQFIVLEDSVMIEIAFVKKGKISAKDINRKVQGGKIINNKFFTLDQLKENNWTHL